MLPKKRKLTHTDFRNTTFKRFFETDFFVIKKSINNCADKFSIVISKKITKKAVERNRMKRIVFSFLQKNLQTSAKNCYVIIVKKFFKKTKEVENDLNYILSKIRQERP